MTNTEGRWQQRGVRDDSISIIWIVARAVIMAAGAFAFYFAVEVAAR